MQVRCEGQWGRESPLSGLENPLKKLLTGTVRRIMKCPANTLNNDHADCAVLGALSPKVKEEGVAALLDFQLSVHS